MVTVNWQRLASAIAFYTAHGYTYVEAPWAVDSRYTQITCPKPQFTGMVNGLGALVGSAEQSFLAMDLLGDLPKGRYVACTPCVRLGDHEDDLHFPTFMKVELYCTDEVSAHAVDRVLEDARTFMQVQLTNSETGFSHAVQRVRTDEGYDLELAGIEVGSYGMRDYHGHGWVYGTGIAEPRFGQAITRLNAGLHDFNDRDEDTRL